MKNNGNSTLVTRNKVADACGMWSVTLSSSALFLHIANVANQKK